MSTRSRRGSPPVACHPRPAWRRLIYRFAAGARVRWTYSKRPRKPARPTQTRLPDIGVAELREIERAAEASSGSYGATDRTLIGTAATERLRDGELLALRWGDIDWIAGTVSVKRSLRAGEFVSPKIGRARTIRLAPRTRAVLRRHRSSLAESGPGDLVFPDPTSGGCLDPSALRRRFRAALQLAGLPAMHLFQLRLRFKPSWWSRYL